MLQRALAVVAILATLAALPAKQAHGQYGASLAPSYESALLSRPTGSHCVLVIKARNSTGNSYSVASSSSYLTDYASR